MFLGCREAPQKYPWLEGDYTQAPRDGKIIMIDFWSPGCSPCVKYLKTTFTDERVIKYARENLHSYKYDAWIKENVELQRKFVKFGVPFIVFLDQDLNEIDFLTEYKNADEFLGELERIKNGVNTFNVIKQNYETNPDNKNFIYKYAAKLDQKEGPFNPEVRELYNKFILQSVPGTLEYDRAKFQLSYFDLYKEKNPEPMIKLLSEISYRDFIIGGMEKIAGHFRSTKDTLQLLNYYKSSENKIFEYINNNKDYRFFDFLERMAGDLNACNLEPELCYKWSKYAVENAAGTDQEEDLPYYYETYSRVLFKAGKKTEAINAINKALKLLPDEKDFLATKKFVSESSNDQ